MATRLVAEREEEIRAFVPQEYWTIEAELERVRPNLGDFKAQFYGREKKMELRSREEAEEVVRAVSAAPFSVTRVKRQDKLRNPAPPFTTSTLQQEASRKLNMTPARTMSIAQQLYEGVDITGEGTVGLITYMRTDSLRLSVRPSPPPRALSRAATARSTIPPRPDATRPRAMPRTPTRPSVPPT